MNLLKTFISMLGVFTALMYFHGLAFYEGWMSYWNLEPELFPISLEETLVYGYRAYGRLSIWLFYILGLTISIIIFFAILRWLRTTKIFEKFTDNLTRFSISTSIRDSVLFKDKIIIFFVKFFGISFLLLTCIYTIFFVYREAQLQGYDAGFDYHHTLRNIQRTNPLAIYKTKEGESYEGTVVTCSEKYCALFASGKIIVLALSSIDLSTRKAPDILKRRHTKHNPRRFIYSD
ncbi:MAG: hypothetical protein ACL93V_14340 [Candidatus Electrothrix sp. YB6]